MAFEYLLKEPVLAKSFPWSPALTPSHLVSPLDFYSRYVVVQEKRGYVLCGLMLRHQGAFELRVAQTLFCDLGEPVEDLFYAQAAPKQGSNPSGILVICLKTSIMLHDLGSRVSINFPLRVRCLRQKSANSFEMVGPASLLELTVEAGPLLRTKELLCDLAGFVQLSPTPPKDCWHLVSEEGSVWFGEWKAPGLATRLVLPNHSTKILSARNQRDGFSNVLALEKQVGSVARTEYLSNQPHLRSLLRLSHSLPCSLAEVAAVSSSTVLLTSSQVGSLFVDLSLSSQQLCIRSSPEFKSSETKERTLLLKKVGESVIQVTETKVVLREAALQKTVESRDLFENMQVAFDWAFYCNRTLGLVVRGQLHFYAVRSQCRLESRFIHVFDLEVEFIAALNDYQLVLLKFRQQNTLRLFQVDWEKETLSPVREIDADCEAKLGKVFSCPVLINESPFSIAIATRLNESPLVIIAPNELKKTSKEPQITVVEFKALPADSFSNLIQVTSCYDIDKCTLRDIKTSSSREIPSCDSSAATRWPRPARCRSCAREC